MTPLAATEAERAYQAALTTYPNPNSPHGSVNERWRDDVKAYIVGYLAARALQQTAEPVAWTTRGPDGKLESYLCDKDRYEAAGYKLMDGHVFVPLYAAAPDRAPSTDSAAGWISVEDRLPDTTPLPDGNVPTVLVHYKREALADNLAQVATANTVYVNYNKDKITHWQPLLAPPIAASLPQMKEE